MAETKQRARKTTRKTAAPKQDANVFTIPIDQLDENPDNDKIYNMDDSTSTLARIIRDNGFTSVVEVFPKPDGRYEITSGHRRVRAAKECGMKSVPCVISETPDEISRARKLLDSNLANRNMHPLDYARAIDYYVDHVLKPSHFKGDINKTAGEYFGFSPAQIYKYRTITKMEPKLQELANDPRFPFTAFISAHLLSKQGQDQLYDTIMGYKNTHRDDNGEEIEISRVAIETEIRRLKAWEQRQMDELKIKTEKKLSNGEQYKKGNVVFSSDDKEEDDGASDSLETSSSEQTSGNNLYGISSLDDFPIYDNFSPDWEPEGFLSKNKQIEMPAEPKKLSVNEKISVLENFVSDIKSNKRQLKKVNNISDLKLRLLEIDHDIRGIIDSL